MIAQNIHHARQMMSVSRLCLIPVLVVVPVVLEEEVLVFVGLGG